MDDALHWDTIHQKIHNENVRHSNFAETREKLFPRASNICDIGGGTGNDAAYFLSQGHSVVLLDISEFALEKAREKADKLGLSQKLVVKQIHLGLHKLPLVDNSIDVAFSRIALHYFESSHTAQIFSDIYRALKPGGKAYLTFKSPDDLSELEIIKTRSIEFEPGVYIEDGALKSRFTKEQLGTIVSSAGIKNFEINSLREPLLEPDGTEHYLLQNEVVFTKG